MGSPLISILLVIWWRRTREEGEPAAWPGRPAGSQRPGPVTSPAGVGCPAGPGGIWTTGLRSGWGAVSLVCTK